MRFKKATLTLTTLIDNTWSSDLWFTAVINVVYSSGLHMLKMYCANFPLFLNTTAGEGTCQIQKCHTSWEKLWILGFTSRIKNLKLVRDSEMNDGRRGIDWSRNEKKNEPAESKHNHLLSLQCKQLISTFGIPPTRQDFLSEHTRHGCVIDS